MNDKQWQKEAWAKDVPYRLGEKLDEFEVSDEKPPTLQAAIDEARYIIGLHNEGGTVSSGMLAGEYGKDDQKEARKTVKDCEKFIAKYDGATDKLAKAVKASNSSTKVKIGQIWGDTDKRMKGRRRRIIAIEGEKAVMWRVDRDMGPKNRVAVARLEKGDGWTLLQDCP